MISKTILTSSILISSALYTLAVEDFVRQTDLDTNVTVDTYIDGPDGVGEEDGDFFGALPVGPKGLHYELYGLGLGDDTNLYLLDETITSAHIPSALLNVSSDDPYTTAIRTRADVGYDAQFIISGIQSGDDAPDSSKYLYFERLVAEYPEGEERLPIDGVEGDQLRVVESFFINGNGASAVTSLLPSLDMRIDDEGNAEAYTQKGEERIRIYALPNENLDWYVLSEEKVYIWPLAEADILVSSTGVAEDAVELSGEDEEGNEVIQELTYIPTLHVSASDLYPSSISSLRIYKGTQNDTPTSAQSISNDMVTGEYELSAYDTVVPQTMTTIVSSSVLEAIVAPGETYTVELITTTPFATNEIVTWITFKLPENQIKINASIHSSE